MALNTVSSDRLSTNVKTSNLGTELKGKIGQNKNLIINGAMQVAQRGTSATSVSGEYKTVDRFQVNFGGTDEAPTQAQADVASATTPYTSGFRKSLKITNGNQTSGAGAADNLYIRTKLEAQDIANSGWNYLSSSSFITLQFWVKSSVAQNFYGYLQTIDGTDQAYPFETGSLTADTWTKVTKTIPGNSNLQFDNDSNVGLTVNIAPFWGTDYTDAGVTLNAWAAYASGTRAPNYTSTWYTTNDATFEITGVQLELGQTATDFEHRSFGDELLRCQRYYENVKGASYNDGNEVLVANGFNYETSRVIGNFQFKVEKRARPSTSTDDVLEVQVLKTGAAWYSSGGFGGNSNVYCTRLDCTSISTSPLTAGQATEIRLTSDGIIHFDAEL